MQQEHYALRKHLSNGLPDYEEDEEIMSNLDMYGEL